MGNRAVIAFESMPEIGIYLHWNGGVESVDEFLAITKSRGARSPKADPTYALPWLVHTITEFFSESYGLCVGIGPLDMLDTDNGDNGLYWIGAEWEITKQENVR